jgi:hypothetical protein
MTPIGPIRLTQDQIDWLSGQKMANAPLIRKILDVFMKQYIICPDSGNIIARHEMLKTFSDIDLEREYKLRFNKD